ncbi:MAG: gamma-glutamyltransferase, partial [Microbacteriaceae bacterium]|nr:gamma-glutamyltransferase [Microbacteriaceae bacterium]
ELARDGYYLYPLLHHNIEYYGPRFSRYPENRRTFMPNGRAPEVGTLFQQPELACTIQRLIEAERSGRGDRDARLAAVHDCFYRGAIAREITEFHAREGGFVTREDLAGFEIHPEPSLSIDYKGYVVHACDVWCQGIVLLETLKILEGTDLRSLGHNSPQYIHTLAAALNLAFADREAYVGDPRFVQVPVRGMLDSGYAERQRARITADRAFREMPAPGGPLGSRPVRLTLPPATGGVVPPPADTIYACAADAMGNAYSATLSDTTFDGPMIPGLGICLSTRGSQSRLDPDHPSYVAPGKRPRLTPNPALALRDGKFYMAFGTPGGDMQTQAMLQVFLNINEFGFQPQQAVEAPRFGTFNFPNSFAPHDYRPGRLCIETRISQPTMEALREFGYDVEQWEAAVTIAGAVCAIRRDPVTGLLQACADPRRESHASAW